MSTRKFDLMRPHLKISAFGTGNLGDDLMLEAILKDEPTSTVIAYGKPRLTRDVPYIPYSDFISEPERYIEESGGLDFGGGNLFWSMENLFDMVVLAQQAKIAAVPVTLNRVGLQGYEFSNIYSKLLLKLVDSVSVRDSDSADICMNVLGRKDCELKQDYAFELIQSDFQKKIKKPTKVGINFSDIRLVGDEGFRNHVLGVFSELARAFDGKLEFYYLPFCIHIFHSPENDAATGDYFWNASNGLIKYYDNIKTTTDLVNAANDMDVLIGHRFHLQVIGYALKKLVIPVVPNLRSKFSAIAKDNFVQPIFLEHSQAFITYQIAHRLNQALINDQPETIK